MSKNSFWSLVLIFGGWLWWTPVEAQAQEVKVIKFEALTPRLHQENDTVYVINFWATWCKPCVEELPNFNQVLAQYKDKPVKALFVSLDFPNQLKSRLLPFLEKNHLEGEVVLLDEPKYNSWIDKVSPEWQGSIPATLVYCKRKDFREFYEQEFTFESLHNIIKPLVP